MAQKKQAERYSERVLRAFDPARVTDDSNLLLALRDFAKQMGFGRDAARRNQAMNEIRAELDRMGARRVSLYGRDIPKSAEAVYTAIMDRLKLEMLLMIVAREALCMLEDETMAGGAVCR